MKTLTLLALICLSLASCKKSTSTKVTETLTIVVSSVPTGGGYTINCIDQANITASNPGTPFFSITAATNQTYTTDVYAGETVSFNDNFIYNGVYRPGAIINVSVNNKVLLTTPSNEDSGFHSIRIP
jgi:hypothetical protein